MAVNNLVQVFCPGKNNKVLLNTGSNVSSNVQKLELKCESSAKFTWNNQFYELNRLNCSRAVAASVISTERKCADGQGHISEIGYETSATEFLKLYDVCYDSSTASTFWSNHIINGKAIKCK